MGLLTPQQHRDSIGNSDANKVAEAIELCNERIADAIRRDDTGCRVHTNIDYSDWHLQTLVESELESAGYRVDAEMSVRHGLIIDIEWDPPTED